MKLSLLLVLGLAGLASAGVSRRQVPQRVRRAGGSPARRREREGRASRFPTELALIATGCAALSVGAGLALTFALGYLR
ncbi:MAG TPA: hypothetical protein VGM80_12745 [Gaiellaceae bacterium]